MASGEWGKLELPGPASVGSHSTSLDDHAAQVTSDCYPPIHTSHTAGITSIRHHALLVL
jgi:hypothetical protein